MNSLLGHIETLGPYFFRKVNGINFSRIEVPTSDGDFLELDYLLNKDFLDVVIICHGLEGSSQKSYVRGLAKYFFERGVNVLAINYRSCGGKINRLQGFIILGKRLILIFVLVGKKLFLSRANFSYRV